MADPIKLATPPAVEERARQEVIEKLEAALVMARDGQLNAVLIIAREIGNAWMQWHSAQTDFTDMIGKIEVAKWAMINDYERDKLSLPIPKGS